MTDFTSLLQVVRLHRAYLRRHPLSDHNSLLRVRGNNAPLTEPCLAGAVHRHPGPLPSKHSRHTHTSQPGSPPTTRPHSSPVPVPKPNICINCKHMQPPKNCRVILVCSGLMWSGQTVIRGVEGNALNNPDSKLFHN